MRGWWKRGREALAFLSDVGGALLVISASLALILGGGVYATSLLDTLPLALIATGVGLLAMGLSLHLLRDRLRPPPPRVPVDPSPSAPPGPDPFVRASELQQQHHDATLKRRRAARVIREELIDNGARLHEMSQSRGLGASFNRAQWHREQETLLALEDATPFRTSRQAYRNLDHLDERRNSGRVGTGAASKQVIENATDAVNVALAALDAVD